jgi:hypothetical protein
MTTGGVNFDVCLFSLLTNFKALKGVTGLGEGAGRPMSRGNLTANRNQ